MIRSNLTATQRERHKTALYAVWADMLKRARKEYNMFQKYKIPRDFPVDSSFREFAGFMLWARLEQGYVIGRDDAKQICRVDLSRDWSPENCFFSDKPELESDVEFITAGASKVISIKVSAKAVKAASVKVVNPEAASGTITLERGQKLKLTAQINPFTSQDKITFLSKKPKIAKVSKKGLITAVSPGTAKIIVRAGRRKQKLTVIVN